MITVLTDSEAVQATLDRYLLTGPTTRAPGEVFRITFTQGTYQLRNSGSLLAAGPTVEAIIPTLQGFLDTAFVRELTGQAAIHAGCVSYQKGPAATAAVSILLPGASHSGKSTLVLELLHRGFTYFSDEYALIDAQGLAHPYPRALMLREGRPDSRPVLPSELGATVGTQPAPVALILALEYRPDAVWNVQPVPQSEMLLRLLKSTPHTLQGNRNLRPLLLRVSQQAACYAGTRGAASDTVDHILELLAELK